MSKVVAEQRPVRGDRRLDLRGQVPRTESRPELLEGGDRVTSASAWRRRDPARRTWSPAATDHRGRFGDRGRGVGPEAQPTSGATPKTIVHLDGLAADWDTAYQPQIELRGSL